MLRTVLLLLLVVLAFLVILTFSWLNPGSITVDVAFAEVTVLKSLGFTIAIVIGWMMGMLSMLAFILKLANDKRRLRKIARIAQAEASNLKTLPISNAS